MFCCSEVEQSGVGVPSAIESQMHASCVCTSSNALQARFWIVVSWAHGAAVHYGVWQHAYCSNHAECLVQQSEYINALVHYQHMLLVIMTQLAADVSCIVRRCCC